MKSELNYVTYQTFPDKTANSLQTITNIKYLIRNGIKVNLYFHLKTTRNKNYPQCLNQFLQLTY